MKTFDQLTVGDKFYRVYKGQMKYDVKEVEKVEVKEITYGYSSDDKIPRFKTDSQEYGSYSRYSSHKSMYLYFTKETDAIRYCKAQMMKNLFILIDGAQRSIDAVKQFKVDNLELLNHTWTEEQIRKLEKELIAQ